MSFLFYTATEGRGPGSVSEVGSVHIKERSEVEQLRNPGTTQPHPLVTRAISLSADAAAVPKAPWGTVARCHQESLSNHFLLTPLVPS